MDCKTLAKILQAITDIQRACLLDYLIPMLAVNMLRMQTFASFSARCMDT